MQRNYRMKLIQNKHILLFLFYFLVIILISYFQPEKIDWKPSFDIEHTKPYGLKVFYDVLKYNERVDSVYISDEPFYNTLREPSVIDGNYLLINRKLDIDSSDFKEILAFVSRGNELFLSLEQLPKLLTDTLKVEANHLYSLYFQEKEAPQVIHFSTQSIEDSTYVFKNYKTGRYITSRDTIGIKGQGLSYSFTTDSMIHYARIPFGGGNFYLHTDPFLFTNYHILKNNADYVMTCLQPVLGSNIILDQYFLDHKLKESESVLKVFLEDRNFRWVYWLTILGLLFYYIFQMKREQRPIPVIEPYRNRSKEFASTLGQLYFNTSNNKVIADKKIIQLKSDLYQKYGFKDVDFFNNDQIEQVMKKSAFPKEKMDQMITLIQNIQETKTVSNDRIHKLSKLTNEFFEL